MHFTWYKYLTTKTFGLTSFANSFCVMYTQLNVGSTGILEVEGVLKQPNFELLIPTFSSPRESILKICLSGVPYRRNLIMIMQRLNHIM